jgi:hypothetical protein
MFGEEKKLAAQIKRLTVENYLLANKITPTASQAESLTLRFVDELPREIEPWMIDNEVEKVRAKTDMFFIEAGQAAGGGDGGGNGGDGKAAGPGGIRSRADLKTAGDKARYIGEHGSAAYLDLPNA